MLDNPPLLTPTPEPPPRPFESPLSDADTHTLARLLFAGVPSLSGSITASDAGKVLGVLAWMMARERERAREKLRMEEAELDHREYAPPTPSRDADGVLTPSAIIADLLTSVEMRAAFSVLMGIMQAVTQIAADGLPFGALQGFASRRGGQAIRLLWYLRAKASGNFDDKADRMRELRPHLRTWANTLPPEERSKWLEKSNIEIGPHIDGIETQGRCIWNTWGGYLAKLGYRIENYVPGPQWDLPIYEPFDGQLSYKPPAVSLLPVPVPGPLPSP